MEYVCDVCRKPALKNPLTGGFIKTCECTSQAVVVQLEAQLIGKSSIK